MVKKHPPAKVITRLVDKKDGSDGWRKLAEVGQRGLSFEAVVLRHPHRFSAAIVEKARAGLKTG